MYTDQEILNITQPLAKMIGKASDKKEMPDLNCVYKRSLDLKERIMTHAKDNYFPEKLYANRAPNQTDKEMDYIKNNHKTITYKVWQRFLSVINRIWNDTNWSVKNWGKVNDKFITANKDPQKYFEEEYPEHGSLEEYFKGVVTEFKQCDPNAVIVFKPDSIPLKNIDGVVVMDDENNPVVDDGAMINPVAEIYGSESVIDFEDGQYALVLTDEVSEVTVGDGKKVMQGLVFAFYDDKNIYLVIQYGKKSDYTFKTEIYWNHNLGYLPARKLKGRVEVVQDDILYKSNFLPACDPLDLALIDNSNLIVCKARFAFPKQWEFISKCEYRHDQFGICNNGKLHDEKGRAINCPGCDGSGYARSAGIFHTTQIPMPDQLNPNTAMVPTPPMGYVTPDISTLQFLRSEIIYHIGEAESVLNIKASTSNVNGGSDTALEAQIDREEQFSFLLSESNQIFTLFEFALKTIQKMRYGVDAEPPQITYPKNFAIRTVDDLLNEISVSKEKGVPDIAVRQIIVEFINTRFSNYENENKVIHLVLYADRVATLSSLEILAKKNAGTLATWEDILHTSIYNFIEQAIIDNPNFISLDLNEQRDIVVKMAQDKEAELSPKRIDANSIIANANAPAA